MGKFSDVNQSDWFISQNAHALCGQLGHEAMWARTPALFEALALASARQDNWFGLLLNKTQDRDCHQILYFQPLAAHSASPCGTIGARWKTPLENTILHAYHWEANPTPPMPCHISPERPTGS